MNTDNGSVSDTRPRIAALIAGAALLVMAIIAPLSTFGGIDRLIIPGDPVATAANLVNSATIFRLATVGLMVVVVLDIVVAWGLYVVFRRVNGGLSLLGAWMRLVYAAIFAIAIDHLFVALRATAIDPTQALFFLEYYHQTWQAGLIVFGVHLGVVGLLVWRSDFAPRVLGVLLVVAGVGYVTDGLGTLLTPTYGLELSTYTFVGEVILIFWLLIRGRTLPDNLSIAE